MMKITVFELLRMVLNGKAPEKIKWSDLIFEKSKYNATPRGYYYRIKGDIKFWFLDEINSLNDEVEILEEKKIPEKLDKYADVSGDLACEWNVAEKKLKDKINEIIDYLKSKGE